MDGATVNPELMSGRKGAPTPRDGVLRIEAYKTGESGSAGTGVRPVKLSSNENPAGPSPRAIEAYRRAADNLGVYPDGGATALREAIGAAHGVDPAKIVCGAGSDELIGLLCHAYAGPDAEIIHTRHAFAMYRIYALGSGANPVAVEEADLTADVDAILAAVTDRTRIVFLANPNNPTGTYIASSEVRRLADGLPSCVLLVLDGAYAEYMRAADFDQSFDLVEERANVVFTRTFSKIHGLAALRLGWMYGPPPVIDAINRMRGPFNVSAPTQAAGAAAIADTDYVEACALQNEVWRDWMAKRLRELGLSTPDSHANFVLPRLGAEGPFSTVAADAFLRGRGLYVRRMESYGMPDRLRITVGAAADNVSLVRAMSDFLNGGRAETAAPAGVR